MSGVQSPAGLLRDYGRKFLGRKVNLLVWLAFVANQAGVCRVFAANGGGRASVRPPVFLKDLVWRVRSRAKKTARYAGGWQPALQNHPPVRYWTAPQNLGVLNKDYAAMNRLSFLVVEEMRAVRIDDCWSIWFVLG